ITAPSATSASKRPVPASFCNARGISSAPGTVTTSMSPLATPSLPSSAVQADSRPSPTSWLNRPTTMPMRRPAPEVSGLYSKISLSLMFFRECRECRECRELNASSDIHDIHDIHGLLRLFQIPRHFQIEPGHARHLARRSQKFHACHAEVA